MWKHKNFINLQLCAGETWLLNETINSFIRNDGYTTSFVCDSVSYSWFGGERTSGFVPEMLKYDDTLVYMAGSWENQKYRTVTFATPPTGDLLTWLQANGTKQSAPTPTLTFKHFYDAGTIGSGTVKFRHYSQTEPLPQLATPQNVTADGTTVSWDEVENATSYEIYADGVSIGTVENETGIPFTIAGTTYRAEEGMTWEHWCDSKYNTGGYTYHGTGTVSYVFKLSDKQFTIANADNSIVNPTDKINANVEYIHMAYPKVTIINSGGISLRVYNYYKEEADAGYNANYINAGSQITISGEPVERPGPPLQYVHIWAYGGIIPTLFEQDIDVTGSIDLMQIINSVHAIFYVGGDGTITARPHDDD